jgi:hypothetical protein
VTKKVHGVKSAERQPRSGADRQRKYRASRKLASIDISLEVQRALMKLREKTGQTTDQLLTQALVLIEERVARGARRRGPPSVPPGSPEPVVIQPEVEVKLSSPGDKQPVRPPRKAGTKSAPSGQSTNPSLSRTPSSKGDRRSKSNVGRTKPVGQLSSPGDVSLAKKPRPAATLASAKKAGTKAKEEVNLPPPAQLDFFPATVRHQPENREDN